MASRVSVQVMMDVFQLLDNNPLLGHYGVKMAKAGQTRPQSRRTARQAMAPHQVWFADQRYLVKIDGQWLYSIRAP